MVLGSTEGSQVLIKGVLRAASTLAVNRTGTETWTAASSRYMPLYEPVCDRIQIVRTVDERASVATVLAKSLV